MKSRTVLVMFFVLCTAVFSLFSAPLTAQAAPGDLWARWFVEVAFENNKPNAKMTVEIGHETRSGQPVIDISKTYPLNCQEHGSLHIVDNVAEFDGNSFLSCEMPNFQELVYKLTEGKLVIDESCTCKLADGLANVDFDSPSQNPLFYTPSLQFSAPTNSFGNAVQYELNVGGAVAISEEFSNTGKMQFGGGAFIKNGNGYAPEFQVDGLSLASSPPYIAGLVKVPTNEKEFIVGHNPDTGEFLYGKLDYLYLDPGCVGHGGI